MGTAIIIYKKKRNINLLSLTIQFQKLFILEHTLSSVWKSSNHLVLLWPLWKKWSQHRLFWCCSGNGLWVHWGLHSYPNFYSLTHLPLINIGAFLMLNLIISLCNDCSSACLCNFSTYLVMPQASANIVLSVHWQIKPDRTVSKLIVPHQAVIRPTLKPRRKKATECGKERGKEVMNI